MTRPWKRLVAGVCLRRLRPLVSGIGEHEATLERLNAETQQQFLAVGESLKRQVICGASLMQAGERLLGLANDRTSEHDPMREAVDLIRRAFDVIAACGRQTTEMVVRLDGCHEQLRRLRQDEEQLERILGPLRTIQTLFRIEAARLPAELQSVFHSVTVEIARLDSQVSESFSKQSAVIESTKAGIAATSRRLKEQADRQSQELAAKWKRIEDSIDAMSGDFERSRARDQQVAAILREIDQATSQVIINLQYQDITRQRLEHVLSSLGAVKTRFGSRGSRSSSGVGCWIGAITRLESHQMEAIEGELRQAAGRIESGMGEILSRVGEIERACEAAGTAGSDAVESAEVVRVILGTVKEVGGLVNAALSGVEEAIGAVESFDGIGAAVTTTMQKLATDIRLIGLNAQVQAVQAGSPGLEVLSGSTYMISAETARLARTINDGLGEAMRQVDAMAALGVTLRTEASEKRRAFETEGLRSGQRLEEYGRNVVAVLSDVQRLTEELRSNANAQLQSGGLGHIDFEAFHRVRGHLDAMAEACSRLVSPDSMPAEIAAEMAELEGRYTMDSERDIHAAVFGASLPAIGGMMDEEAPEPAQAAPGQRTMGDNVELF